MRDSLGQTIVLYALALTAWSVACALTGRTRPPALQLTLVVLEIGLVLQAVFDLVSLGRSDTGGVLTNLGYALTSVAVLPIAAGSVRLDPGRWGSVAVAIGCVLAVVVTVRLHQTLATTRA